MNKNVDNAAKKQASVRMSDNIINKIANAQSGVLPENQGKTR